MYIVNVLALFASSPSCADYYKMHVIKVYCTHKRERVIVCVCNTYINYLQTDQYLFIDHKNIYE